MVLVQFGFPKRLTRPAKQNSRLQFGKGYRLELVQTRSLSFQIIMFAWFSSFVERFKNRFSGVL
jgi:hypothetical protein